MPLRIFCLNPPEVNIAAVIRIIFIIGYRCLHHTGASTNCWPHPDKIIYVLTQRGSSWKTKSQDAFFYPNQDNVLHQSLLRSWKTFGEVEPPVVHDLDVHFFTASIYAFALVPVNRLISMGVVLSYTYSPFSPARWAVEASDNKLVGSVDRITDLSNLSVADNLTLWYVSNGYFHWATAIDVLFLLRWDKIN